MIQKRKQEYHKDEAREEGKVEIGLIRNPHPRYPVEMEAREPNLVTVPLGVSADFYHSRPFVRRKCVLLYPDESYQGSGIIILSPRITYPPWTRECSVSAGKGECRGGVRERTRVGGFEGKE